MTYTPADLKQPTTTDRDPRTYAMIGAMMAVHSELGRGFAEPVYQEAAAVELAIRAIPFEKEKPITITYKGTVLKCTYRADFICYGEVLLELKALDRLSDVERGQVINYLKATGLKVALLVNFGRDHLEYERIVLNY